jgi:hypothetical protein
VTGFGLGARPEVVGDDGSDEEPENHQELALLNQVRLAGLVDQFGDLEHRPVDRHVLQLPVDQQAEQHAERRDQDADKQQRVAVDAHEADLRQVRQNQIRLAAGRSRRRLRRRRHRTLRQRHHGRAAHHHQAGHAHGRQPRLRIRDHKNESRLRRVP